MIETIARPLITEEDMDILLAAAKRVQDYPQDRQRKAMLNALDSLIGWPGRKEGVR